MFQLSPSKIARYFFHECDRHLRFHATPAAERAQHGVPRPPHDHSPVTEAILEGGYHWETEVVEKLLRGRVKVAPAKSGTLLRDRTHDVRQTLAELAKLKSGELLYQGTLVAPPSFYEAYGLDPNVATFAPCRPDLIEARVGANGTRVFRIIDVKASDALKTSHKIQTALYTLILHHVLKESGIQGTTDLQQAAIWLYGASAPQDFELDVVLPHVQGFLATEIGRILANSPSQAAWHLDYRCEWCEYFDHCRAGAVDSNSVSLLPYLTTLGRNHLRTLGIDTLADLHSFLDRPDAEEQLDRCASLAGKAERLRQMVSALVDGEFGRFGGSSLAMPRGENIRLLLTVQREPVSGRIYTAALLRTGSDAVFTLGGRHEETFVAASPDQCEDVRRNLIRRLHAILSEVDYYNRQNPAWQDQRSLQTYVYDSYEATLLTELLIESLSDPAVAREALQLFFHFQSEDLLEAEQHPAGEVTFPIVVLTSVCRSLFALPIPLAYHFSQVLTALPPEGRKPLEYRARKAFNFRLSNALRSDPIHWAWHHGQPENAERIAGELRWRLWAAHSIVDGIRSAAMDQRTQRSILFAWPPKFRFADSDGFHNPVLSKLAFITRYESVLAYLDIRETRTLPRNERERRGKCLNVKALGGDRYAVELSDVVAELEGDRFTRWLLTEDTPDGDESQMAFPDYGHRDKWWVPQNRRICFATIGAMEVDKRRKRCILRLTVETSRESPIVVKGKRYLLHPAYTDWNTGRVIDRLRQIDENGAADVNLLSDPHGYQENVRMPDTVRTLGLVLGTRAGFTQSQRRAFEQVLAQNLTLLWGPPGTGKTFFLAQTIVVLLLTYRRTKRPLRILVSGYTHAAIENCLQKIEELCANRGVRLNIAKLGSVLTQAAQNVSELGEKRALAFLQESEHFVLGATPYAIQKLLKDEPDQRPFDVVVIDEGSQVRVAEAMLVLSRVAAGGRVVVAGDDMQLPPIIRGDYPNQGVAGQELLHRSLFEVLRHPDRSRDQITCQLYENFRMNSTLCRFPAEKLYGSQYRSANNEVACRRIHLNPVGRKATAWMKMVVDPAYPLVLCVLEDVQAAAENPGEAALVADLTRYLRDNLCRSDSVEVYADDSVGDAAFWREGLFIVSPHRVQIRAIRRALAARDLRDGSFVDTVDKMQGQECDVVVVSYGVSDPEFALQEGEFIYSLNRLNVAMTRARRKCILFLPRPLLRPTLLALEGEETAAGIAYMLELERFAATGVTRQYVTDAGRMTVYRAR